MGPSPLFSSRVRQPGGATVTMRGTWVNCAKGSKLSSNRRRAQPSPNVAPFRWERNRVVVLGPIRSTRPRPATLRPSPARWPGTTPLRLTSIAAPDAPRTAALSLLLSSAAWTVGVESCRALLGRTRSQSCPDHGADTSARGTLTTPPMAPRAHRRTVDASLTPVDASWVRCCANGCVVIPSGSITTSCGTVPTGGVRPRTPRPSPQWPPAQVTATPMPATAAVPGPRSPAHRPPWRRRSGPPGQSGTPAAGA